MFFSDPLLIPKIAEDVGFTIFVVPTEVIDALNSKKRIKTTKKIVAPEFPNTSFYLEPDEKNLIKVDKIRELEAEMLNKEVTARFFVVKHAETMNEAAQNAALKLLEEPKENCHLVFLATSLTFFLPTVLSRANVYVLRAEDSLDKPPAVSEDVLEEAKLLITSSSAKTLAIVKRWTNKNSKKTRQEVLQILGAAIELSYKSYFKTSKTVFLKKVPNLIIAYENIKANGHIKLQLLAHLC